MNDEKSRKVKSVRFNQRAQVLYFEKPRWNYDNNSDSMSMRSAGTQPKPQPRPPALPPRNAVQVPVNQPETQTSSPPKPPPRAKNSSTASRPKVRIFRRDPNAQPSTEGPSSHGEASTLLGREVGPVILHSRMKVPDTPPPPPPLAPLARLSPSAPSASSALTGPSADDDEACPADLNRPDTSHERAEGTDDDDDDDSNRKSGGCTAGCFMSIVGLFGCIR